MTGHKNVGGVTVVDLCTSSGHALYFYIKKFYIDDYMRNIPLPTKFCWKRIIRGSIHEHESK